MPELDTTADLRAFDRDALLRTGEVVHLAPARPGDEPRIAQFYDTLSDTSTYYRFFGIRRAIPPSELRALTASPASRCVAVLASIGNEVIGIGEFHAAGDPHEAELGFAVSDRHQHEGVATLLLEDLAVIAARVGFARLVATTLVGNDAMRLVLRTAGLQELHVLDHGVVRFTLDLAELDGLRLCAGERERTARRAAGEQPTTGGAPASAEYDHLCEPLR